MILGLGATAFAVVALSNLASTSRDQRIVRARERVESELERLADLGPGLPRAQRMRRGRHGAGELRSGFVDGVGMAENGRIAGLVAEAEASGKMVVDQASAPDGVTVVAGAAPLDGGGYAWALSRVVVGPEMSSLRVTVLCLAVAMLAMVLASVHTLIVFDRGASALRESVAALGRDLHAKVSRPKLRELAEVSQGLDSLARDLSRAQEDKGRLTRELAEHERWAALGRVVAGVAHEVRNPLAAIKLRTDLAETSPDIPTPVREDLALIGSEVARLDRLVRDLLLLADRKPLSRNRVDLAALVQRRAELLRPWAEERGVTLSASGAGDARVDDDSVTRAVDNLLKNAVEASPKGSSVTACVSENDSNVLIAIRDSGPGVPEENFALLFEPFFTTKSSGTGLGLALSRAVAEAHGGSLRHARSGGMTEFTLALAKA